MDYQAGTRVRVKYAYDKFYTGEVLWTSKSMGLDWVTVRPDDPVMVYTFGSSRDMELGYKSYISSGDPLNEVYPI